MGRKSLLSLTITLTVIVSIVFASGFGRKSYTFYGDGLGYYSYLPATFIYHNLKDISTLPEDKEIRYTVINDLNHLKNTTPRSPLGYTLVQYTYGVALMEAPFFFIAHAYEKLNGLPANGYSDTYNTLIKISSLFYSLLGLFFTWLILRNYFSKTLSLFSILLIFAGTNLFWFSLHQAGMAHTPLLFLYAALIYLTIKIHRTPKSILFLLTGLVAGMITLIRPSDIVCLLIPVLYNVYNRETIKAKIKFITSQKFHIALASIIFFIPLIPQFLYWKALSGNYLYYSYGTQSFNWLKPQFIQGLFGFNNGWLPYAPVMIFSVAGFFLYKHFRQWTWCLPVMFLIYSYIIYSWYCFSYINGLGSRPMIHLYPLLAIPLTAFLQYISTKKFVYKMAFTLVVLFFVSVNISYSVQQSKRILISEESNAAYYFGTLYKTRISYNDFVTYNIEEWQPDAKDLQLIDTIACERYNDSLSAHYVKDSISGKGYVYRMSADEEHHPKTIRLKYFRDKFKDVKWLKCSGRFKCTQPIDYFQHIFVLSFERIDESAKWRGLKIDSKIGLADSSCRHKVFTLDHLDLNKWGYVYFYVKIPRKIYDGNDILLDIWNIGKRELFMDDITLETYK